MAHISGTRASTERIYAHKKHESYKHTYSYTVVTNSSRRREFVYPIQHGRECCKHLKKRLIL